MGKGRKLRPEDSLRLQEEIEAYLRSKGILESEGFGVGGAYDQRHDKALRAEDSEFFEDIATLFRSRRDNRHPSSEGYKPGVEKIAILARTWLESLQESVVTAETVKTVTETILAARITGYKPEKDLVFDQTRNGYLDLWVRKAGASLATKKKQVLLVW